MTTQVGFCVGVRAYRRAVCVLECMLALISEFPNALLSKAATKRNLLCLQVFAEVQKVLR